MRTYKRINEDYLDNMDVQLDDISVLDDIREELDDWIRYGKEPSINPKILPDGFYPVNNKIELGDVIRRAVELFGLNCKLNWIDVSRVTDMSWLFYRNQFNGDISRWDVSSVLNMSKMFFHSDFNGVISKWDVSSVTKMDFMFADSKFNGDISEWDVSNVRSMDHMFYNSVFNRDISGWNISKVYDVPSMFAECPILDEYKPTKLPS